MLPIPNDAEPLEFLLLHLDPMLGEDAAFVAELIDRDGILIFALGAVIFLDLPFDRQAMAIPARHIVRVLAEHPL